MYIYIYNYLQYIFNYTGRFAVGKREHACSEVTGVVWEEVDVGSGVGWSEAWDMFFTDAKTKWEDLTQFQTKKH